MSKALERRIKLRKDLILAAERSISAGGLAGLKTRELAREIGCANGAVYNLVADVDEAHRIAMTEEEQKLFGIEKLNVPRSSIPAVTHVDYSARIQTVHKETNPRFHDLISQFKEKTGCPVVVNTSFNVRGEPIVGSPEDAFRCFMGTEIETLAVGNCFLRKESQNPALKQNYEHKFELD
jgi:carbamoyltransferase